MKSFANPLPNPVQLSGNDPGILFSFQRFRDHYTADNQKSVSRAHRHWEMNAKELVPGHFHYSFRSHCIQSFEETNVEMVLKSMVSDADFCFLGLNPAGLNLALLFDGIQKSRTVDILRICLHNQQISRGRFTANPGQVLNLWDLESLPFSTYMVQINIEDLAPQRFMVQLIR